MEAINSFNKIFLEVWNLGVLGINASEIIIGILIFLIFYVLRRLFAKFIINKLNKLVNKTSTTIDNTIVNVIEGPLKFLPIVIGFFIATSYVTLNAFAKALTLQSFFSFTANKLPFVTAYPFLKFSNFILFIWFLIGFSRLIYV